MSSAGDDRFDEFTGSALEADPWLEANPTSRVVDVPEPLTRQPRTLAAPVGPVIVPEPTDLSRIAVPRTVSPRVFAVDEPDPTPIVGITASNLSDILRRAQATDDSAPTLRAYLAADSLGNHYTVLPAAGATAGHGNARSGRSRRTRRR